MSTKPAISWRRWAVEALAGFTGLFVVLAGLIMLFQDLINWPETKGYYAVLLTNALFVPLYPFRLAFDMISNHLYEGWFPLMFLSPFVLFTFLAILIRFVSSTSSRYAWWLAWILLWDFSCLFLAGMITDGPSI